MVTGNFLEYAADSHCSWRRYTVCDDKFVMAASDESSTVIHVDVSLIANDEEELFFAREMHEILSDKIGRDPDDYGPHSAVLTKDGWIGRAQFIPRKCLVWRYISPWGCPPGSR